MIFNDKKTRKNFPCVKNFKIIQIYDYLEFSYITIIPHFFRTCNGTILKIVVKNVRLTIIYEEKNKFKNFFNFLLISIQLY